MSLYNRYITIIIGIIVLILSNSSEIKDLYKNNKLIISPDKIDVLVNKQNRLSKNFIPNDLINIDENFAYKDKMLVKMAKEKFELLVRDAQNLGFKIVAISAYRDYEYQVKLYSNYVDSKGKLYADRCSARPGHSEHQTGLAVDVMGSNNDYNLFAESKEFNWMIKNAHLYGFILRYPEDKENITGYKYEPWHYRYVGKKIAKYLYKNNLTLEEYYEEKTVD